MAKELSLAFMGRVQIRLGETDLTGQLPDKAQALLGYLALTKQSHPRHVLATLLWGESTDEAARRSLRVALATKLRPYLDSHLTISRQSLIFNRDAPSWIDVEVFEHLIWLGNNTEGAVARARLREAIDLYRGDFFEGFDVADAPAFDEWVRPLRERLRQMLLNALKRIVAICTAQEDYEAGMEFVQRLLALDPWREEAHRQLMLLYALNGQRSAALTQYEICRDVLDKEFGVEPSAETEELYHRIRGMEDGRFRRPTRPLPPLPGETGEEPVPFQAPARSPYFLGRDEELARLSQAVTQAGTPGIECIAGMGGIGKTALAIHLAHELRDEFAGGVLWANAGASSSMAIAESWANAYGYDFSRLPDEDSRTAALRGMLAKKQVLLILDNVTQAAGVRSLIPGGDQCAVLITTRNADIAYALNARLVSLTELALEDGRQLLANIIGAERVRDEGEAADEICRLLQNLPLAMTIAARRLASRPRRQLADLARRLRDVKTRLDLKLSDREVRASFAISWNGLDVAHRLAFAHLAVHEGRAFTAEAQAAVSGTDRYTVLDQLDTLVALSLLNAEGEAHYRQHTLLADFAHERLEEEETPYRRMVDYYLGYAAENQHDYATLRPEWDNLSAGIRVAHQMQMWPAVIEYTDVLRAAWFARGRYSEARQAYHRARLAAEAVADKHNLATCLFHWGQACMEQSDYEEAGELFAESLALYGKLGDKKGVANVQYDLARIAIDQADYDGAQQLLVESRAIREELDDVLGVAETDYRRARLLHRQDKNEEARQLGQQALARQESLHDTLGMIRTLRLLLYIVGQLREYDLVEQYGQQALRLSEEIQDQGELALAYKGMAYVCRHRGDLRLAYEFAEKSLALLERMGDRHSQANVLYQMCLIKKAAGEYEDALVAGRGSLVLLRELQDGLNTLYALAHIGDLLHFLGQPEEAQAHWLEALQIARKLQHDRLAEIMREHLDNR